MIKSLEEKSYYEKVCKPPYIYHWGGYDQNGFEWIQCGQIYGNGTVIKEFVNCRKCLRVLNILHRENSYKIDSLKIKSNMW